jgi:hypothetical protein
MIIQSQTTSFKKELYEAVHNLPVDTIKIALYGPSANLGPSTLVYSPVGEVTGPGYTAGGKICQNVTVSSSGRVAYVSFDTVVWNPANFTAFGALIYNASKGNKSVAVIDFGGENVATASLSLILPPNQPNSALIRSL